MQTTDMRSELTTINVESVNYCGEKDGLKKWWEEKVCPFFWPKMAKVKLNLNHPLENLTEKFKETSADTTEKIRDELKNQHKVLTANINDSLDNLIVSIQKGESTNRDTSDRGENDQEDKIIRQTLYILNARLDEEKKRKDFETTTLGRPRKKTTAEIARLEFEIKGLEEKLKNK